MLLCCATCCGVGQNIVDILYALTIWFRYHDDIGRLAILAALIAFVLLLSLQTIVYWAPGGFRDDEGTTKKCSAPKGSLTRQNKALTTQI